MEKSYCLQIIDGDRSQPQKQFFANRTSITVGRKGDFRIRDLKVSRVHACIRIDNHGIWLEDLQSTHGTYIDGKAITKTQINSGTVFSIGKTSILFLVENDIQEEATLVPEEEHLTLPKANNNEQATVGYCIEFIEGPKPEKNTWIFAIDQKTSIGRQGDICLPDIKASKLHAQIEYKNKSFWLTDLQSKAGTYVDEQEIDAQKIKSGTIFRIAQTTLLFTRVTDPLQLPKIEKNNEPTDEPASPKDSLSPAVEELEQILNSDNDFSSHVEPTLTEHTLVETQKPIITLYSGYYHLKIKVMRSASDYGIHNKKNIIVKDLHLFCATTDHHQFTIGSDDNDYIQIKDISRAHTFFKFSEDGIHLQNSEKIQLKGKELKEKIKAGETYLLDANILTEPYKIIYPNNSVVAGKIEREEELLSEKTFDYLTNRHGQLEQIFAGLSSLIFKTPDNKVIKVLRPSNARNKGVVTRFLISARKLHKKDPACLEISGVGCKKNLLLYYLVMQYFPGETLKNYLGRKAILTLEESCQIIRSITEKLVIFQECHYACRNLTPENILLCEDGSARITTSFLVKTDTDLTGEEARMVIPRYSSLEQMDKPSQADIYSDMFSLGVIFFEMLTGETPFETTNIQKYLQLVRSSSSLTPEKINKIIPQIPYEICKIISSLLSCEKDQRISPKELIVLLDKYENKEEKISTIEKILEQMPLSNSYCLEIIESPSSKEKNRQFTFRGNRAIVIGKKGEFHINNDKRVSSQHACVEVIDGQIWLTDLQSSNGTYVDGKRIARQNISSGATFTIGNTKLLFTTLEVVPELEEEIEELQILELDPETPTKEEEPQSSKIDLQISYEDIKTQKKVKKDTSKSSQKEIYAFFALFLGVIFLFWRAPKEKVPAKKNTSTKISVSKRTKKLPQPKSKKQSAENLALARIEKLFFTRQTSVATLKKAFKETKKLANSALKSPFLGDYYNLKARILFASIYSIDAFGEIPQHKIIKVTEQTIEIAKLAEIAYHRDNSQTRFRLKLVPWMREAKLRDITPLAEEFPMFSYQGEISTARQDILEYKVWLENYLQKAKKK